MKSYQSMENNSYLTIEECEKAIKHNPEDFRAYFRKGILLSENGKGLEAISAYKKTTEINSEHNAAFYNLGIELYNIQNYEESISAYEESIKLNPKYSAAYGNMGAAYLKLERLESSKKSFEKAIEINSLNSSNDLSYFNLGYIAAKQGNHIDAISYYNKSIEANSSYADAYHNLAASQKYLGRYSDAQKSFEQYSKLLPYEVSGYMNQATSWLYQKIYDSNDSSNITTDETKINGDNNDNSYEV